MVTELPSWYAVEVSHIPVEVSYIPLFVQSTIIRTG